MPNGDAETMGARSDSTGSVYGDLLRQVVASEAQLADRSVVELVAVVLARRSVAVAAASDRNGVASRLSDALSYDAALVRLCDRLGVPHDLVSSQAGPAARSSAEEHLAERLPAVAAAVTNDDPDTD